MGKYTHLSSSDRSRFYTFLEMKLSITDIAKKLGKHRSELERNKEPEGYLAGVAQLKTNERAQQKGQNKIEKDGYLQDYVVRSLKKSWSPEQISGRMKYHKLTIYVCPETIYQFVYRSKNKELYPYHTKNPKDRNVIAGKKVHVDMEKYA